jgi:putative solute:sodium symporter small subunit
MRNLTLKLLVTILVTFPVAFLFVRHMESAQQFDSFGWWYTLYVAAFFAAFVAAIVTVTTIALARRRAKRLRASRK